MTRNMAGRESERVRPVWLANGQGEKSYSGVKQWSSMGYMSTPVEVVMHMHESGSRNERAKLEKLASVNHSHRRIPGLYPAQRCDPGSTKKKPT